MTLRRLFVALEATLCLWFFFGAVLALELNNLVFTIYYTIGLYLMLHLVFGPLDWYLLYKFVRKVRR